MKDYPIKDRCAKLLITHLSEKAEKIVAVLGENSTREDYEALKDFNCTIVTNRFDIAGEFVGISDNIIFNDFDFSVLPRNVFDVVLFRLAKEKAVTHHVINSSSGLLKKGGLLLLCGYRSEGIKTYAKKTATLFGSQEKVLSTLKGARCVAITKLSETSGELLPTEDYSSLREIHIDDLKFFSKPGIFGWKKIDVASKLMVANLESLENKRVLDFGCGYGYLSILAKQLQATQVDAIDNNAAAILAARKNFEYYSINGEVQFSDAGENNEAVYDIILCNPPYHVGFSRSAPMRRKFLINLARLISADGSVYIVVDLKMPYELWAKEFFSDVSNVGTGYRFKVLKLKK